MVVKAVSIYNYLNNKEILVKIGKIIIIDSRVEHYGGGGLGMEMGSRACPLIKKISKKNV